MKGANFVKKPSCSTCVYDAGGRCVRFAPAQTADSGKTTTGDMPDYCGEGAWPIRELRPEDPASSDRFPLISPAEWHLLQNYIDQKGGRTDESM